MIVIKRDCDWYLEIYSDAGKRILEIEDGNLWDTNEDEPIAVNKQRYENGEYVESEYDIVGEEEDATEEIE